MQTVVLYNIKDYAKKINNFFDRAEATSFFVKLLIVSKKCPFNIHVISSNEMYIKETVNNDTHCPVKLNR